ncbi:MAG: hypothetical protein P8Z41_14265, partial [Anaerolineales bacterium]
PVAVAVGAATFGLIVGDGRVGLDIVLGFVASTVSGRQAVRLSIPANMHNRTQKMTPPSDG